MKRVKKKMRMILTVAGVLLMAGCGERQEIAETADAFRELETVMDEYADTSSDQTDAADNVEEHTEDAGKEDKSAVSQEKPVALQNLNAEGSLFTHTFYRAGNGNIRLTCYVKRDENGDEFLSDQVGLFVTAHNVRIHDGSDEYVLTIHADAEIKTVPNQNTYQTKLSVRGYQNEQMVLEDVCPVTLTFPSGHDSGQISIKCSLSFGKNLDRVKDLMGEYYSIPQEELFSRCLCKAELCAYPTEDLRLMRNLIYAVHGRKFQDKVLAEYMERQPWYRGIVEPEAFSEEVLSDTEKKNIALLKELEQIPANERAVLYGEDYSIEGFEFAPYFSLLSQNKETGLSADLAQSEDCGAYFCVQGKLYLPVTLTRTQWENVRNGGTEELCINELTGETRVLEYDAAQGYLFYEKGSMPESLGSSDIWIHYNFDTGLYEMQEASDDTIMKIVYEGDLYFLKGAVWGGMVSLMTASELQQEITLEMQSLYGNCLYHNGRGYFTAIYALGD